MKRILPLTTAIVLIGIMAGSVQAQSGRERPAVDKAVAYLKGHVPLLKDAGEAAFASLAMMKAEVPHNDPALLAAIGRFAQTFNGAVYKPETKGGPDTYEAAVVLMALVALDAVDYKPQFDAVAQFLISKQMANGAWDYSDRTAGDTSMSQYAILALWEAENAGVVVPPEVWDRAAKWYLGVQAAGGSWNYHRDTPSWPETISMTGAGVGSLMVCQKQLVRHRKGQDLMNPLMIPVTIDGQPAESRYKVETPASQINNGISRGTAWLTSHFQVNTSEIMGQSPYYALYGLERVAAFSGSETPFGSIDWYGKGLDFAIASQKGTGAWHAQHEDLPNTCWAVLFSVKSTKISQKKIEIRKLGGGKQAGGRGMPTDLNNVEVVSGQLVARPMGGAIEGMLKVLEDPNNDKFESALNGLVARYQAEGSKVLKPLKDRFRKLLNDREPYNRQVAIWGLGRTGDLDVAPILIKSLLDPDDSIVTEARIGLEVLSRKLEGYGPVGTAPMEEKVAAARKWQAWFQSVKPPDLDAPELVLPAAPQAPAAGGAPKTSSQ